ncbi:hypothetical protein DY130_01685 [Apilactobacillus micheneri]|uniref:DUF5776 domain-containing protein n=1 Tax=Apilactobacillus micheneri TaxID=1899430 RepID=A0A9Q8INI4_9LACO|nr:DUF5776 domain-containing protein [Apilactobacillus micheneri]TPR41146.1 hypothetical protein DY121_01685 [Apilactobacillus micheneri]TPR42727.1 hypothetical protein DY123_01685 [Apilactobacillus micheneri]TPR46253.1 hypothetical protein DY130_01685 [Apilactobacillus micheneri]TPR46938.1 hypothetical protein DY128_01685 [Apilactobacillus micheneri]
MRRKNELYNYKIHYKMYKSGKSWAFLAMFVGSLMCAGFYDNNAYAKENNGSPNGQFNQFDSLHSTGRTEQVDKSESPHPVTGTVKTEQVDKSGSTSPDAGAGRTEQVDKSGSTPLVDGSVKTTKDVKDSHDSFPKQSNNLEVKTDKTPVLASGKASSESLQTNQVENNVTNKTTTEPNNTVAQSNVTDSTSLSTPSSSANPLSSNNVKQNYNLTLSNNNQTNLKNFNVNVNVSQPSQVNNVLYDKNIFNETTDGQGNYKFVASQYPPVQSNIVFQLATNSSENNGKIQPINITGNYNYNNGNNINLNPQTYYVMNNAIGSGKAGSGGDPTYLTQGYQFPQAFEHSKYAKADNANIGSDYNAVHQFFDVNKSQTDDGQYYQTFMAVANNNPTTLGLSSNNYKIDTSATRAIVATDNYYYVMDHNGDTSIYIRNYGKPSDGNPVSNADLLNNPDIQKNEPKINWDVFNDNQVDISRANQFGKYYYLINHVLINVQNKQEALATSVPVQSTSTYNDGKGLTDPLNHVGKFIDLPEGYTSGNPFISGVSDKTINLTDANPTYQWSPYDDINNGLVTASAYDSSAPAATKYNSLMIKATSSDLPANNIFTTPDTYQVTYNIVPDGEGHAKDMYGNSVPINPNFTFQPITQTITVRKTVSSYINYYDDTSKQILKTDTVSGNADSTINYSPDESILTNPNFKVISNPFNGTPSIKMDNNNDIYTYHLVHNISNTTEQKIVTSIVKYQDQNGKTLAPENDQQIVFSRNKIYDPVLNNTTYSTWSATSNTFKPVSSPIISGYLPDKDVIGAIDNVGVNSSDIMNYVTYKPVTNNNSHGESNTTSNSVVINNSSNNFNNSGEIENNNNLNNGSSSNHESYNNNHLSNSHKYVLNKKVKKHIKKSLFGKRIYAIKGLNMYRKNYFTYRYKIRGFKKHIRINRPMFKVIDYAKSSKGHLRYKVIMINPYTNQIEKKHHNHVGYITANTHYVLPLYYEKNIKRVRVIAKGLNEYRHINLTGKVRGYKHNSIFKVKSVNKMGTFYRLRLFNGNYITANKRYVKFIKH